MVDFTAVKLTSAHRDALTRALFPNPEPGSEKVAETFIEDTAHRVGLSVVAVTGDGQIIGMLYGMTQPDEEEGRVVDIATLRVSVVPEPGSTPQVEEEMFRKLAELAVAAGYQRVLHLAAEDGVPDYLTAGGWQVLPAGLGWNVHAPYELEPETTGYAFPPTGKVLAVFPADPDRFGWPAEAPAESGISVEEAFAAVLVEIAELGRLKGDGLTQYDYSETTKGLLLHANIELVNGLFDDLALLESIGYPEVTLADVDLDDIVEVDALPDSYYGQYDIPFIRKFIAATIDVGARMARDWDNPASVAEELAARLTIQNAHGIAQQLGIEVGTDWVNDIVEDLFDDTDHMFLYDGLPPAAVQESMGIHHMAVNEWFHPFNSDRRMSPYADGEANGPESTDPDRV